MFKSFDIYNQNNLLKIVVALNLMLVGTGSLLYTDRIIGKLEKREEKYVQLYGKAVQYALQQLPNTDQNFVVTEILQINQNSTIPLIYVDQHNEPVDNQNIKIPPDLKTEEKRQFLKREIAEMRKEHPPLKVDILDGEFGLIYYGRSTLLRQLRYLPYAQFAIMVVLGFLAYLSFSSSRRAEQNRVWVGLAKETAHQLGTPLSSLMAWVEYFRADPEQYDPEITEEIEKDVHRLETITARFSSIGSVPTLRDENLAEIVQQFTSYLAKRISTKVKMSLENQLPPGMSIVHINRLLFEWVIENICKNAVDAMGGIGELRLKLLPLHNGELAIDITDTGKGIAKGNLQRVFMPGFSTKKRGWGLGLTLAKRIVEEYHGGKLFVKESIVGKGTTFRIVLKTSRNAEHSVVQPVADLMTTAS
jgi:signal transduction histidine kinase